jgi:hypothetical protein
MLIQAPPDVVGAILDAVGLIGLGTVAAVSHFWCEAVHAKQSEWGSLEYCRTLGHGSGSRRGQLDVSRKDSDR